MPLGTVDAKQYRISGTNVNVGFEHLTTVSSTTDTAALEFTGIEPKYKAFRLIGSIQPATDSTRIYGRLSTAENGWYSGSADYKSVWGDTEINTTPSEGFTGDLTTSVMVFTWAIGNASPEEAGCFDLDLINVNAGSMGFPQWQYWGVHHNAGTTLYRDRSHGVMHGATTGGTTGVVIDGIRFHISAGDISAYDVSLYGMLA